MKKKLIHLYLGISVIAVLGLAVPAAAAEPETGTVTAENGENTAKKEITLDVEGKLVIANETETEVNSAKTEATQDKSGEEEGGTIILDTKEGQHKFENTFPEKWTDMKLIEDHGFLYIRYTDTDGASRDASETKEAVTPKDKLTMWALTSVNIREEANADSAALKVAEMGGECEVLEIQPGWYKVEYNGVTGYINHKYLSDDKETVDAAIEAAKAAEAAAAAAQSQTYSYDYSDYSYDDDSYSGGSSGGGSSDNGSAGGGDSADGCLSNGLLN